MEEMTREDAMKDLEATIRDWLDARGLVAVPKEMTTEMLWARDWKKSSAENWAATLAAAPDPFKEASE